MDLQGVAGWENSRKKLRSYLLRLHTSWSAPGWWNSVAIKNVRSYLFLLLAVMCLAAILLAAMCIARIVCEEREGTSHPVDVVTARNSAAFTLPVPNSATNVQFSFRQGGTMDSELWLKFNDAPSNVESLLSKEVNSAFRDQPPHKEYCLKRPLSASKFKTSWSAPGWWNSAVMKSGWFMGSTEYEGPRVWMDTASNTAYYYQRN